MTIQHTLNTMDELYSYIQSIVPSLPAITTMRSYLMHLSKTMLVMCVRLFVKPHQSSDLSTPNITFW